MTTLFFLLTSLFILLELTFVLDEELVVDMHKLKSLIGAEKKNMLDKHTAILLFGLIYWMWLLTGMFMATQWALFLIIIAQGIVGGVVTKKMSLEQYRLYKKIDVAISVSILLYIAWNHFHS